MIISFDMEISVFDVGHGDCLHLDMDVTYEDGTRRCGSIMIDTGTRRCMGNILNKLANRNKSIDFIVLSHDHSDHTGGLSSVLNDSRFAVSRVIYWSQYNSSPTSLSASRALTRHVIYNHLGATAVPDIGLPPWMNAIIHVLHPNGGSSYASNKNQNSIVLDFELGNSHLLFMGDATATEERMIVHTHRHALTDAIFLKVGHHGSQTSSSNLFLNTVINPNFQMAVVSCLAVPRRNRGPDVERLRRIKRLNRRSRHRNVKRTGDPLYSDGNLIITVQYRYPNRPVINYVREA